MRSRTDLRKILKNVLRSDNLYFQPPESVKMSYPCIIYAMDDVDTMHADNRPYLNTKRYSVTIIDKDPDSEILGRMAELPMCRFVRFYTADNLNHWVFNLYF